MSLLVIYKNFLKYDCRFYQIYTTITSRSSVNIFSMEFKKIFYIRMSILNGFKQGEIFIYLTKNINDLRNKTTIEINSFVQLGSLFF